MINQMFLRRAAPSLHSVLSKSTRHPSVTPRERRSTGIESLESRIAPAVLIGGIGTGLHKTSVSFTDADGDLVKVSLTGGGYFDITLDGHTNTKSDIDNINITGAKANSILTIDVTSKTAGSGAVTAGFTNVNSITSSFTGTMKSINLNSAEVQDIDLATVKLSGGLTLDVTNAAKSDTKNLKAAAKAGTIYEAITPGIDMNNVTLCAADSITIRGALGSGENLSNDFDGAITVTDGLHKLVGTRSTLNGSLTAGTLGGVVIAHLNGGLNTTGDMTLDVQQLDANAFVTVGGDLNLRLGYAGGGTPGAGSGLYGHVQVAGNVSGLAAGPLDAVSIRGDFQGILSAGGNIANVSLVSGAGAGNLQLNDGGSHNGQFAGSLIAEGDIGNVSAQQGFDSASFIAANGSIGDISSLGTNSGTFAAGGTIGKITSNVMAPGRDAVNGASFTGQEGIGSISATSFNGRAIVDTSFASESGDIGTTLATVSNLKGSDAITDVAYSAPSGTVADITGTSAGGTGILELHVEANRVGNLQGVAGKSSTGSGIIDADVTARLSIGDVQGMALGSKGGDGLKDVTLVVQTDHSFGQPFSPFGEPNEEVSDGSIGDIVGITYGIGVKGSIGFNIDPGTGFGINGLDAKATHSIGQVAGIAFVGASGIANSSIVTEGGSIEGVGGETGGTGDGLASTTISTGSIGGIYGYAQGMARTATSGNGIASIIVNAGSIDHIEGRGGNSTGSGGYGIVGSSFGASSIGDVDASASYASAIESSDFSSGNIGLITANSYGGLAISGGSIGNGSSYFNYDGIHTNGSVNTSINTTGGYGTLGSIQIGGNFTGATLAGVFTLGDFSVSGAVTGTVGSSAVDTYNPLHLSTASSTIVIGNEPGSQVVFSFQAYNQDGDDSIISNLNTTTAHEAPYVTPSGGNVTLNLVGSNT
jgi:hypothetical protein